jgi:mono/diheme cytochrome c family protein
MRRTAARCTVLCTLLLGTGTPTWPQSATPNISYKTKCEVCHGTAGLADTPEAKRLSVLPFTDPSVVAKTDSALIGIIQNGSGKMPPFDGKLSDQEINALIQFIRQVQNK